MTAASHATDVNLLHDHLQQCNDAEDALDIARIARDGAATTIRDLYTRACQAVLGNLPVGDGMRGEVLDVRRVKGKSQTGVIDKGRKPVSLWQNVNTHRAGMSPGQSPLLVGTTGVGEF